MTRITKVKPLGGYKKVKVHILDSLTREVTLCGKNPTDWAITEEKVTCSICKRGGKG